MAKKLTTFEAEQSELVKEFKAQLKEKDRVLKDYQKSHGQLQVLVDQLLMAVSAISPKPILYKPSAETSSTEVETVLQCTDWHIGGVQLADEIEGINAFNLDIAKSRVADLSKRFNRVVDRSRNSYNLKTCHIISTGDMISGDIHEELKITNEFPSPVQVVKAAELFAEAVGVISQNFAVVKVEYITADNHSRLTKKPQSKEEGMNSFNYLVAIIAKKILSKHSNVEFNIYTEPQKVIAVGNRKYLCMHGHQIQGWGGIPWYGWDRKVGKESTSRLSMIMEEPGRIESLGFHKIVAGHYHQSMDSMHFSIGGSLSGTDAYDHKNGRYAPPSQPSWFVSPRYGEFGRIDYML